VVTLTGPGGVAKTRLALEISSSLAAVFPDGVWWVPLAGVVDPALVRPAVAETIGARGDVAAHLATSSALIVLDNFEHVVDAADFVHDLVARAPRVHVLVTSRERLALPAEREWPVTPLAHGHAVEMFVELARRARPDVEPDATVRQICDRLDCLPLALELASTRLKVMTPDQMLDRLGSRLDALAPRRRGVSERQATMRAALGWSYDLLTRAEQSAFRTVAFFRGGFEFDAAVAVCGLDLGAVEALVDKSLVQAAPDGRFSMLETTREYGLEKLRESGDLPAVAQRHAEWFRDLALAAGPNLQSAEQTAWLVRLRTETDNFRVALEFARDHDPSLGVAITAVITRPWRMRGLIGEVVAWYDSAFSPDAGLDDATVVTGLRTYGLALFFTEDYARAEGMFIDLLAKARANCDRDAITFALQWISSVQWSRGATDAAIASLGEALSMARADGDRAGESRTLHLLGENQRDAGDFESARASLETAVAIDLELGDRWSAALSIHSLADLALDIRDGPAAAAWYLEAMATGLDVGDERTQAYCVAGLASVAALDRDAALAGQLWGSVVAAEERCGFRMLGSERARYERVLRAVSTDPIFTTAVAGGRRMTLVQARDLFTIASGNGPRHSHAPS
jgi:predicted ATPase